MKKILIASILAAIVLTVGIGIAYAQTGNFPSSNSTVIIPDSEPRAKPPPVEIVTPAIPEQKGEDFIAYHVHKGYDGGGVLTCSDGTVIEKVVLKAEHRNHNYLEDNIDVFHKDSQHNLEVGSLGLRSQSSGNERYIIIDMEINEDSTEFTGIGLMFNGIRNFCVSDFRYNQTHYIGQTDQIFPIEIRGTCNVGISVEDTQTSTIEKTEGSFNITSLSPKGISYTATSPWYYSYCLKG